MNTPLPVVLNPKPTHPGLTATSLPRLGGWTEHYLHTQTGAFTDPDAVQAAVLEYLQPQGAGIVLQRDMVSPAVLSPGGADSATLPAPWPRTVLQDISRDGSVRAESQVYAVSGARLDPLMLRGRTAGVAFEEPAGEHVSITNLTAPDPSASLEDQTNAVFDDMETLLAERGMTMKHVVRTWFFLDDILGWYDTFNRVRTDLWRKRRVFDHLLPASTGIGMTPASGGKIELEVRAFKPREGIPIPREVYSDKQCPADRYGSSFSRAVLEEYRDLQRMHVSGTASINEKGATIHPDDLDMQIEQTLDSVQNLLEADSFKWDHTIRAIAYYAGDVEQKRFEGHLADRFLGAFPCVHVPGTVCRDDLLFELELEAIKTS